MGMTWRYDAEANTVFSEGTGPVTSEQVMEYLRAILADESIQSGFIEVTSFEHADLQLSYDRTVSFPDMWKRYAAKGCRGTVICAPSDANFGMLRMVQTVLDQPERGARFIVVRTREEFDAKVAELRESEG